MITVTHNDETITLPEKIITICCHCHQVKDVDGNWYPESILDDVEVDYDLSHGICPDCMKEHYPDY